MDKSSRWALRVAPFVACLLFFAVGYGGVVIGAVGKVSDSQIILTLHLESDVASLTKVKLLEKPYKAPRGGYAGMYTIKLFGYKAAGCRPEKELLYEKEFFDPTIMFWDDFDPDTGQIVDGGMENLDPVDFMIVLPYLHKARLVEVYRQEVDTTQDPPLAYDKLLGKMDLPPKHDWETVP